MLRTVLFLVAISALSGPALQDNPQHSFKVYQEDNVTVAITSGGPKYTEPLFDYEVVLTLKENPDRPESILFRPGDICMDYLRRRQGQWKDGSFQSPGGLRQVLWKSR